MTKDEVDIIRKAANLLLSTATGTELLLKMQDSSECDYSPHEIAMMARVLDLREMAHDLLSLLPENH